MNKEDRIIQLTEKEISLKRRLYKLKHAPTSFTPQNGLAKKIFDIKEDLKETQKELSRLV